MCWSRTLTLVFLSLLARLSVPAQPPTEASPNAVSKLVVTVGKSLALDSPLKITRLAAANSELIESIAIGPKEVLINGKLPGETSLVVWLENGTRLTYDLIVRASPQRLIAVREQVARDLPGGEVDITLDNDTAFVRGRVKDMFSAERVMAIASTLGKTVNLLRVDIPPVEPQILLHVKFATVDRSASSDLGLDLASTAFNQTTAVGTGSPISQTGGPPFSLSQAVNLFLFRRDLNLAAAIHALEAKRQLQLLAEPNLMVINNTAARFVAGGEFPFPMVQPGVGSSSVTIAFKEYGIKLGFLPVVTPRGTIRLQVAPEVSTLDYTNSVTVAGTTVPGTSTRRVQTEVELDSGQSFVIAGLLDNTTTESLSKIPGIGNIPLLGKLFQSRSISRNNSELLVIITPEIVRPIAVGQPVPALQFPSPFTPPVGPDQPSQPGIDKTGPVPVHPPADSMPFEQLLQQQKLAPAPVPAVPATTSSPGRLTGQENGRHGAEPPGVVTYGYWDSHPVSGLAMVGGTLRLNGHTGSVTGLAPNAFLGASPMKLVGDLRRPPPVAERVAAELADNAFERRERTMFQSQTYSEDDLTPIIRHVRLAAGGRLVAIREQDLEMFPGLPAIWLGSITLIALCLALLTGLAFGLMPAWHVARAGLAPALSRGGNIALRPRLSLRNRRMVCQVAGWLALLLIIAFLMVGSRGTAGVEIGFDPGNLDLIPPHTLPAGYPAMLPVPFCQKVLDRGRSFPSVRSASLTETVPIGLIRKGMVTISADGLAMANSPVSRSARMYVVRNDDFDTAGIGIPPGGDFHKEDEADGATTVSPTEQLVRQCLLKE
jgi:pilus assembly protein CpaC